MYGIPLTAYILLWIFGVDKLYTLEFLLTQLVGEEAFFVVFRYFIFPLSTIIIILTKLCDKQFLRVKQNIGKMKQELKI